MASISTTWTDASISTSFRASVWPRSDTRTRISRGSWPSSPRNCCTARIFSSIPTRECSPKGWRRCRGCRGRSSATAAREAVEACLKFARRSWFTAGDRARTSIVALHGSFHGRTMGSLSVTADPHYRDPFGPLLGPVTFVTPNDDAAIAAAITPETAVVVLEPIQGEGGVRPLTPAFARAGSGRLRPDGNAPHLRRGAVGPRPHGRGIRLSGAGSAAVASRDREGTRRRHPNRRRAGQRGRRITPEPGRPRQHLWRQPARVPGGPVLRGPAPVGRSARATSPASDNTWDVSCRRSPGSTRSSAKCAAAD